MRSSAPRRSSGCCWSAPARSWPRSTPGRTPSWRASRWRWTRRCSWSPPAPAKRRTSPPRSVPTSARIASPSSRRGTRCPTRGWIRRPRSRPGGPMRSVASAPPTVRSSSWRRTWPRCRDSRRRWAPFLRCSSPRASSWRPTRSRSASPSSATSGSTWSSIAASSPSGAASSTCSPASPGGPRASSTGATRSSASASSPPRRSCPRNSSAGSRSRRCESSSPTTTSARSRRRAPPTSPTGSATGCSAWPTDCASREPTRSRRSCSTICPPRRSSCPPAAGSP